MYAAIAILGFSPYVNLLTFSIPMVVYGVEKKSKYVKENAIQAVTISLIATIIYLVFMIVSVIMTPRCTSTYVCFGSSIIHKAFGFYGSLRWMVAAFVFIVCLIVALRSYNYENAELNELSKINLKIKKILDKVLKTDDITEDNKDKNKKLKNNLSIESKPKKPQTKNKQQPVDKKIVKQTKKVKSNEE